jgi:hypothetical protein
MNIAQSSCVALVLASVLTGMGCEQSPTENLRKEAPTQAAQLPPKFKAGAKPKTKVKVTPKPLVEVTSRAAQSVKAERKRGQVWFSYTSARKSNLTPFSLGRGRTSAVAGCLTSCSPRSNISEQSVFPRFNVNQACPAAELSRSSNQRHPHDGLFAGEG